MPSTTPEELKDLFEKAEDARNRFESALAQAKDDGDLNKRPELECEAISLYLEDIRDRLQDAITDGNLPSARSLVGIWEALEARLKDRQVPQE